MRSKKTWLILITAFVFLTPSCNQVYPTINNSVYEIFVRSFYDSNGDGIGDLNGLREKLDYLNDGNPNTDEDLEVGILWLMPVFPSPSYHGYDVNDYRSINPDYGTLNDFDNLIKAAHSKGIRVILDITFNHTSTQHPWFEDAVEHPITSPYKDYYFLRIDNKPVGDSLRPKGSDWHWAENSSGQKIYYFGDFSYTMPDLNMSNPKVRAEVKQIAKFWLDRGTDGFRLDAAKHIFGWTDQLTPEEIQKNINWWKEFSDFVYSIDPSAILVGEVLDSPEIVQQFAAGLDAELDFHFKYHLRRFVKEPYPGFLELWKNYFDQARQNNPKFELYQFLSSHDENPRFASFVKENVQQEADAVYRVAMYLLFTMDTYPILYYGDEIKQEGWKWKGNDPPEGDGSHIYDETLREPFQWYAKQAGSGQTSWFLPRFDKPDDGISVEEQSPNDSSILSLVRALTSFRAEHLEFANGEISNIFKDTAERIIFEKKYGDKTYLVLINNTSQTMEYEPAEYQDARLLFRSGGMTKQWKDFSDQNKIINGSVSIPSFGLVILSE
jgi:alpha-amylase